MCENLAFRQPNSLMAQSHPSGLTLLPKHGDAVGHHGEDGRVLAGGVNEAVDASWAGLAVVVVLRGRWGLEVR